MAINLETAYEYLDRIHEAKHNLVGGYTKKEAQALGGALRWDVPYVINAGLDQYTIVVPKVFFNLFTSAELANIESPPDPSAVLALQEGQTAEEFEPDEAEFKANYQAGTMDQYWANKTARIASEILADPHVVRQWKTDDPGFYALNSTNNRYRILVDLKQPTNGDFELSKGNNTNRPLFGTKSTANGDINVARFNGADQVRELISGFPTNLFGSWVVMTAIRIVYDTTERVVWQGRDSNGELRAQLVNGEPRLTFQWGANNEVSLTGEPLVDSKWQELAWGRDANADEGFLRVRNDVEARFSNPANLDFSKVRIGNNSSLDNGADIDFLEMLVLDNVPTEVTLRRYRNYLRRRRSNI